MNKSWFYLGVMCSLAIVTTSCGDGGKPPTPAASPSATASPAASPAAAVPPVAPAASTPTATPKVATTPATVPGKATAAKPVSVDVAAGLIPPTDADNWAKTVSKGRSDPFAMLALQPIEIADPKDPFSQTSSPKQQKIANNPGVVGNNPSKTTPFVRNSSAIKSGVNKPLPSIKIGDQVASNSSTVSAMNPNGSRTNPTSVDISKIPRSGINRNLPKIKVNIPANNLPKISAIARVTRNNNVLRPVNIKSITSKTTGVTEIAAKPEQAVEKVLQAMSVEVSGVIEVGGRTQVIVKLPNEAFSRYVEVGERVGGNILVKRVEGKDTLAPTVVLQEGGVEVQRRVGEKSAPVNPISNSKP